MGKLDVLKLNFNRTLSVFDGLFLMVCVWGLLLCRRVGGGCSYRETHLHALQSASLTG